MAFDEAANGAAAQPRTMILDANRLRMSTAAIDFVFRGDLNKVWVLRSKNHTYFELTPGGLGQMGARMDQAMAQMKEKLAAVPEAQRKQVEAMMASHLGLGAATAPPQVAYEKAGDSRTVGDWRCAPYQVVVGGKASSEVCIAKLSDLGLSRDDLTVFASFGAFMAKMTAAMGVLRSPMSSIDYDSMTKAIGFDGQAWRRRPPDRRHPQVDPASRRACGCFRHSRWLYEDRFRQHGTALGAGVTLIRLARGEIPPPPPGAASLRTCSLRRLKAGHRKRPIMTIGKVL
jgi:hypothetical protein